MRGLDLPALYLARHDRVSRGDDAASATRGRRGGGLHGGQQGLQGGPYVVEDKRLHGGRGVDAVGLEGVLFVDDALQHERHQRDAMTLGKGQIYLVELPGVRGAVIGRQAHAQQ